MSNDTSECNLQKWKEVAKFNLILRWEEEPLDLQNINQKD